MLRIELYPACLKCTSPDFKSSGNTRIYLDHEEIDQSMYCSHRYVCKFIDGQSKIELEGTCK